jgi:hypothetical protein
MQKDSLKDYAEHYQDAKAALNVAYTLAITNGKQAEAIKMATLASNEATKFMQALRKELEK